MTRVKILKIFNLFDVCSPQNTRVQFLVQKLEHGAPPISNSYDTGLFLKKESLNNNQFLEAINGGNSIW